MKKFDPLNSIRDDRLMNRFAASTTLNCRHRAYDTLYAGFNAQLTLYRRLLEEQVAEEDKWEYYD